MRGSEPSMANILGMVASLSGFSVNELTRWATSSYKPQSRAHAAARDEAMWLMWNAPDAGGRFTGHRYSLPQIGRVMGGMHHTSVLTATRRHEARMQSGLFTPLVHTGIDWKKTTSSTTGQEPPTGCSTASEVGFPQFEHAEPVAA